MIEELDFDGSNELRSVVSAHVPGTTPSLGSTQIFGQAPRWRYPFTDFVDLYTDGARRIRKRIGKGTALFTGLGAVLAIHEYERVDPTSGAVTFYQIVATATAINVGVNGGALSAATLPSSIPSGGITLWSFLNFENRCFAVNGKDPMIVFDGTTWRIVGQDAPAATLLYSLGGKYLTGTVGAINGSPTITGTVPAIWVTGGAWNNLYIDINGVRYQISTVATAGNGTTIAPVLTLTEGFKEATQSGMPYVIYTGAMSWTTGPRYAAAYYNPTTGHCSEPGPYLQITEQNQVGVTPTITLPHAAQNQTAFGAGYTQIKLFRTFLNGSALMALNVVINNVNDAVTDIVYTESVGSSTDVILTNFAVPKLTNLKPPTALASLASWQGRMWADRPSDPTNTPPDSPRTYFCLVTDETSIGVAEECWPRRFERHGISQPKGVISVGGPGSANGLVILGNNGDYTLDGYDNLTFTQPYRMPTRQSGGFRFGAIDVRGTLVELYRDKRLFAETQDLGEAIQDKLNAIQASAITLSRLTLFAYEQNDLLLLTIPKGASANNYTLVLDYDRQRFNEWNFGYTAANTVHGSDGSLQLWIGDAGGNVFQLLQSGVYVDGASTQYQPFFRTAPIRRDSRKQLRRVHIFVGPAASSPAGLTWQLNYRVDGETTGTTVNMLVAPADRQSQAGLELYYEFEKPVIFQTLDLKVTFPSTTTELYVEKMTAVIDDAQTSPANS